MTPRNFGTMCGILRRCNGRAAFPGGGSNSGTAPVSPSVMATQMASVDAAGRGTLQLLVLWRGSPGWFIKGGGASQWRRRIQADPGRARSYSHWISQGGVNLSLRFDPAARKVWIQDTEIALDDANVMLVDGVDSPAGPQVVRTLRIDPEYETNDGAAAVCDAPAAGRKCGRGRCRRKRSFAARQSSSNFCSATRHLPGLSRLRAEDVRSCVLVGEIAMRQARVRRT